MRRLRVAVLVLLAALAGCGLFRHGDGGRAERPRPDPIDLNSAPLRKVERLPGITPSMAKRIVEGRPYESPRDLVERGILTERELRRIDDHVTLDEAD